MAENDGAERAYQEAGPEHRQAENERDGRIEGGGEEVLAEEDGQHAVEIEVVPLDERPHRGGADDEGEALLTAGKRPRRCGCDHMRFPLGSGSSMPGASEMSLTHPGIV